MHVLLSLLGFAAACALIGAGFGYVFAPAEIERLLRTAASAAGLILCVVLVVEDLERAAGPFAFMMAVLVVSPVAYFVRARRAGRPERPPKLGGAERKPVIPRNIPGGGA
jgi:hypothetical protein